MGAGFEDRCHVPRLIADNKVVGSLVAYRREARVRWQDARGRNRLKSIDRGNCRFQCSADQIRPLCFFIVEILAV